MLCHHRNMAIAIHKGEMISVIRIECLFNSFKTISKDTVTLTEVQLNSLLKIQFSDPWHILNFNANP